MNSLKLVAAVTSLSLSSLSFSADDRSLSNTNLPKPQTSELNSASLGLDKSDASKLLSSYRQAESFVKNQFSNSQFNEHFFIKSLEGAKGSATLLQERLREKNANRILLSESDEKLLRNLQLEFSIVSKDLLIINNFLRSINAVDRASKNTANPEWIRHSLTEVITSSLSIPEKWSKQDNWKEQLESEKSKLKSLGHFLELYHAAKAAISDSDSFEIQARRRFSDEFTKLLTEYKADSRKLIAIIDSAKSLSDPELLGMTEKLKDAPFNLATEYMRFNTEPAYLEMALKKGDFEKASRDIYSYVKWGGGILTGAFILFVGLSVWSRKADAELRSGVRQRGRKLTDEEIRNIGRYW